MNVHPPGFLNARSPRKTRCASVASRGDGLLRVRSKAKTMFDLSWTKQIDWINALNLNCPGVFFLNESILLVVGWLVGPGLGWKFNST